MEAPIAADIAASYERGDMVDSVSLQALVGLELGVYASGVGAPLFLEEHQCVVIDAVRDPALRAPSRR